VTPLITAGVLEDVSSQLTSSFFFGGAMTTEIGLSLSHAFAIGERTSWLWELHPSMSMWSAMW
jgi:hypothetical protein